MINGVSFMGKGECITTITGTAQKSVKNYFSPYALTGQGVPNNVKKEIENKIPLSYFNEYLPGGTVTKSEAAQIETDRIATAYKAAHGIR